ncbi:DUF2511 domain-containing protein [Paenirhodobacter populi]|uniref:DUF2511 domain-containing protein n=1 Tax=Paenirhodobacter populi TaxID=2306993 RepID=UPI000FE36CF5|nr:DUF2511 domain-containing protein [Sinirhodobacter populi]RWR09706.1 hypothetical protein D2T32_05010 [Sinirhodobacter populi]
MSQILSSPARRLLVVLGALVLAAVAFSRAKDGVEASREAFAGKDMVWPLTVERGKLGCSNGNAVWFRADDGVTYAVNIPAAVRFPKIDPIRISDHAADHTVTMNDLIDEGLKLC